MSGVLPRFAPDGAVSFNGALDAQTTCLCSRRPDGSHPQVLIAATEIALDWHDWPQAAGAAQSTDAIGSRPVPGRVLLVLAGIDGSRTLVSASPDLIRRRTLSLPSGLTPRTARWAADGESILFTADVSIGQTRDPHPAAPAGANPVIEYNLTYDPCRPEMSEPTPGVPWQVGCDDTWYTAAQITDWSTVKSFRIRMFFDPGAAWQPAAEIISAAAQAGYDMSHLAGHLSQK